MRALFKLGALPNPVYWHNGSPLLEAVLSKNIETVRALLEGGSKDHFLRTYGMTAAPQAARLGELEIMRELGWRVNDDIVLECGVRGGSTEAIKAIVAVRTKSLITSVFLNSQAAERDKRGTSCKAL